MKKYLIALVIIVVILAVGYKVYLMIFSPWNSRALPVACTMEAKLCPDGVTSVGRQGPNCEFAECPVAKSLSNDSNIIMSNGASVDNFLKEFNSISSENIEFIKKITNYEKGVDAFGKNYAGLSYVKEGSIIYFVDERDVSDGKVRSDVYSLNLTNNDLRKIYSPVPSAYYFHIVGKQENMLLFFKQNFMDSPGPCWDLWVVFYEHPEGYYGGHLIESLDLTNPTSFQEGFSVPKDIYDKKKIEQQNCIKSMQ